MLSSWGGTLAFLIHAYHHGVHLAMVRKVIKNRVVLLLLPAIV